MKISFPLASSAVLLLQSTPSFAFYYPEKDVHRQQNVHTLFQETFQADWWEDVVVNSEFPISSLRYNDNTYLDGGTPMYEDELVVVVKSDCSQEELEAKYGTLQVDPKYNSEDRTTGLNFFMNVNETKSNGNNATIDIDDLSFLPASTFSVAWPYTSYWCTQFQEPDDDLSGISKSASVPSKRSYTKVEEKTSTGTKTTTTFLLAVTTLTAIVLGMVGSDGHRGGRFSLVVALALISAAVLVTSHNNGDHEDRELAAENTKVCKINVEILHDGCRSTELVVASAPAIRVGDVVLENQQQTVDDCTTHYKAALTFPVTTEIDAENSTSLPQLAYSDCYRAVEGRPFLDKNGKQIQAATNHDEVANGWSSCEVQDKNQNENENNNNNKQREALGQKWAQRALGEHASISSFAAFTMALMANNAPPALIQDSLVAASDEVRHAKVSFETASRFLGGQPVEPGPLPPSSHSFQHNLTALALATAREGCIDETLSALLLALEVDEQVDALASITETERANLKEAMTTIALEEASHSALAWRTIQWVCATDQDACNAVQSTVLAPDHAKGAVEARLETSHAVTSPETIQDAWSKIYDALLPYVVATAAKPSVGASGGDEQSLSLTSMVPRIIIEAVHRSDGSPKTEQKF
ncbi:expressed unknown protein [Seminavis robusta]|uniref:Uncharacterized protein n=1 Tax=Seminavis robusta TaxID=568900 RepID=A0A9N8HVX2_9STRA|nr:expressed unknown protein [Seminavis robusta]|eukprot:Sro2021_g311410.1 n/a (643) ;mRNA; f:2390-4318